MVPASKLFLIAIVVLGCSFCSAETRVFATAKGSERISLKDDGTCSFVSNGRTKGGHYKIRGKRIIFKINRRQIDGFYYGDVIRYSIGDHYKSLTLVKSRSKSR